MAEVDLMQIKKEDAESACQSYYKLDKEVEDTILDDSTVKTPAGLTPSSNATIPIWERYFSLKHYLDCKTSEISL